MKWLKKVGISLTVAFLAVCCGAVLLFNWDALGFKALSVPTGSMRPTIPPGSLVLMHRVPVKTLKAGDVITYTNLAKPGTTITHRIVKTYKLNGKVPAFITKGDANKTADRPVVGGQVQGKAVWHVPYLGRAMIWSKTWTGVAILVYVPALLLMIEEVRRLGEYWRRERPYKFFWAKKETSQHRLATATAISVILVAGSGLLAIPAQALLRSNTVTLGPNTLSVGTITPPPTQCTTSGNNTTTTITTSGGGNSNVNVNNSNNQNANSGNATTTGGGTATSGNASNCNSTTTTITIH